MDILNKLLTAAYYLRVLNLGEIIANHLLFAKIVLANKKPFTNFRLKNSSNDLAYR